ncbi:MAG: hypothetical protein NTZ10_05080 [Candidatus Saganbacteria bacterium]|nr:hypothetical protein [Candidatus Saganbacteria bacterium]
MTGITETKPADKAQKNKSKPGEAGRKPKNRSFTGLDLANTVRNMFRSECPGIGEASAMKLAVLLTKAQIKGDLEKT